MESKKVAASLLERAKRNANRKFQEMENRVLAEIRQHYSQELASVRQHYENCISEINKQHYVKLVGVSL